MYIPHHHYFPKVLRSRQENPLSRGIGNVAWGMFSMSGGSLPRSNLNIWTFLKLKTRFFKYWISIKIKISLTCMYKDYKFEIKMVQEQWLQLKMKSFWRSDMKIDISTGDGGSRGGTNLWWGVIKIWFGETTTEGFFLVGRWTKFWVMRVSHFQLLGAWDSSPSRGNPNL